LVRHSRIRLSSAFQWDAKQLRSRQRPDDRNRQILGATVEFIAYPGTDFNGIFDALSAGAYDCVAAGTTVIPERAAKAQFAPPYLISGQSLAVDTTRLPHVKSIDDVVGLTIGVPQGNTSQPIADEGLLRHITVAAEELEQDGTLQRIRRKCLGNPHPDQSLATG
jgi:ABC-type amino acid transport substrate-binding protein